MTTTYAPALQNRTEDRICRYCTYTYAFLWDGGKVTLAVAGVSSLPEKITAEAARKC